MVKKGRRRLLDHLSCGCKQHARDRETHGLRGLEIDNKLELGWLLDGQVRGLRALENSPDVIGSQLAIERRGVGTIAHQATVLCKCHIRVHRRYVVTSRQLQYFLANRRREKNCVVPDDERTGSPLCNSREGRIIAALDNWHDEQIAAQRTRCCQDVAAQVFENHGVWWARQIGNRCPLGHELAQELES